MCSYHSSPSLEKCIFQSNAGRLGGAIYYNTPCTPYMSDCTCFGNSAESAGGGIYLDNQACLTLERTMIVFGNQAEAIACDDGGHALLSCCNLYGNAGGDWVGCIESQADSNGNFSADPLFCDTASGDLHLSHYSPCAPNNNSCGDLIGACGIGCHQPKTLVNPDTMYVAFAYSVDTIPAYMWAGQFQSDYTANDVDLPTLRINETLLPDSAMVVSWHPAFDGEVVEMGFDIRQFVQGYGAQYDTALLNYTVSGEFTDGETFSIEGTFTMIGHLSGDLNLDGEVSIVDLTLLVEYLFADGPPPQLMGAADLNRDGVVNIVDMVLLVIYLFGE